MRDLAHARGVQTVDFNQVELMVLKKGFTTQQLRNCLSEYANLGVLYVDITETKITIDG